MEHYNYRAKGYSKYLPTALADRYREALTDPDLLATDKDIALIDLRMQELTSKLDASDMGKLWVEAHAALLAMERAQLRGYIPEMRTQHDLLSSLIKRGANSRYLWQDLIQTAKDLASLRLAEHRRLVDLKSMLSESQMLQAVGLILNAVREAVVTRVDVKIGRDILADIQARIAKVIPTNRGQEP